MRSGWFYPHVGRTEYRIDQRLRQTAEHFRQQTWKIGEQNRDDETRIGNTDRFRTGRFGCDPGLGDGSLVRRVLAGDSRAYAGLVERYRDTLIRYATRMLGNPADAEEALQDSFVRAYRSLAGCTDPDRFGAWLYGILVNRCRTYGARQRSGIRGLQPPAIPYTHLPPANHAPDLNAVPAGSVRALPELLEMP